MQTETIKIDAHEAKEVQDWLDSEKLIPDAGECETIKTWTAFFGDHIEADIKVVNGDGGPYVDAVLFEEGCEITFLDVGDTLVGEYIFYDRYDEREYKVIVEIA